MDLEWLALKDEKQPQESKCAHQKASLFEPNTSTVKPCSSSVDACSVKQAVNYATQRGRFRISAFRAGAEGIDRPESGGSGRSSHILKCPERPTAATLSGLGSRPGLRGGRAGGGGAGAG